MTVLIDNLKGAIILPIHLFKAFVLNKSNQQKENRHQAIVHEMLNTHPRKILPGQSDFKVKKTQIIFRKKTYDFPPDYDNKRLVTDTADKVFNSWKGLTL